MFFRAFSAVHPFSLLQMRFEWFTWLAYKLDIEVRRGRLLKLFLFPSLLILRFQGNLRSVHQDLMRIIQRELRDLASTADPQATAIIGRLLGGIDKEGEVRFLPVASVS